MKIGVYKHSKTGNLYRVHFTAKHSETLEDLVAYEALYENPRSKFWVRPLSMFAEKVELNGKKVPRFAFVPVRPTQKDFAFWHKRKSILHNEKTRSFFHEREVWWCSLGENIGFEEDGKGDKFARPVLVFKKFNNEICWALPLSLQVKTRKETAHFYARVFLDDTIPRTALLSQLRLIDGKRLLTKIGMITEKNYSEIQKAVIRLCSL